MSSTNKTAHYNLPQFIGSDIPTWLGDFNSAMTSIDSAINAAATSASGAATTAAEALVAANRCPFPIGFGGFFQNDPNSIYAGTSWEQKKDVFILAAGDTYPAGSTGGEAQHRLTEEEMPSHNHTARSVGATTDVTIAKNEEAWLALRGVNSTATGIPNSFTYSTGGDQPHNNMPPYYSMPFWIRKA